MAWVNNLVAVAFAEDCRSPGVETLFVNASTGNDEGCKLLTVVKPRCTTTHKCFTIVLKPRLFPFVLQCELLIKTNQTTLVALKQ